MSLRMSLVSGTNKDMNESIAMQRSGARLSQTGELGRNSGMTGVVYLAAHGGFAGQPVALGGGAAIANRLIDAWQQQPPFAVHLMGPSILGGGAPSAEQIIGFSERAYARFCLQFRKASTERALQFSPESTSILVNDISEGPDFAALHQRGFRVVTIYHVDVVAYIAAIYLRGRVRPAALSRSWERFRPLFRMLTPAILHLIFEQQRASLLYSYRVIVPSSAMRDILLEAYPFTPPERIEVLPWGAPPVQDNDPVEACEQRRSIRSEFGIEEEADVLLCLSRISPEKGQDRLIESLSYGERAGLWRRPLHLVVCGAPAFMQGEAFFDRLRQGAARLRKVKVHFPGYVVGKRKQAFFAASDLYLFPSRHESYGLTLTEALAAGMPSIAFDHAGAREILSAGAGLLVAQNGRRRETTALAETISALLDDDTRRAALRQQARQWAADHQFRESVERLSAILSGTH